MINRSYELLVHYILKPLFENIHGDRIYTFIEAFAYALDLDKDIAYKASKIKAPSRQEAVICFMALDYTPLQIKKITRIGKPSQENLYKKWLANGGLEYKGEHSIQELRQMIRLVMRILKFNLSVLQNFKNIKSFSLEDLDKLNNIDAYQRAYKMRRKMEDFK